MPKLKTIAVAFALPALAVRPGLVRTDWIAEQAQQAANDLSDAYFEIERQDAANDLADEYAAWAELAREIDASNKQAEQARKDARNARDRARRAAKRVAA